MNRLVTKVTIEVFPDISRPSVCLALSPVPSRHIRHGTHTLASLGRFRSCQDWVMVALIAEQPEALIPEAWVEVGTLGELGLNKSSIADRCKTWPDLLLLLKSQNTTDNDVSFVRNCHLVPHCASCCWIDKQKKKTRIENFNFSSYHSKHVTQPSLFHSNLRYLNPIVWRQVWLISMNPFRAFLLRTHLIHPSLN